MSFSFTFWALLINEGIYLSSTTKLPLTILQLRTHGESHEFIPQIRIGFVDAVHAVGSGRRGRIANSPRTHTPGSPGQQELQLTYYCLSSRAVRHQLSVVPYR